VRKEYSLGKEGSYRQVGRGAKGEPSSPNLRKASSKVSFRRQAGREDNKFLKRGDVLYLLGEGGKRKTPSSRWRGNQGPSDGP